MYYKQEKIRNVAIIAHVDHGKTTLVDAFLKQSHLFRDNQEEMQTEQILDSGELEREKGITIKAKNIAIMFGDIKINIIDTPGHADFGGEVERTLNMADGCVLIVDAQEGPMPQTEFVLRKAMELKLKPIVVINKIDKKFANTEKVLSKLQDLFLKLAVEDDQLEFPVFYAIAREGLIFDYLPAKDLIDSGTLTGDMKPLLEAIVKYVPEPTGDINGPLQMQVNAILVDKHLGRFLIGRIRRGVAKLNDSIQVLSVKDGENKIETGKIKKLFVRKGLDFDEVDEVGVGDIAAITGVESTAIGGTICTSSNPDALPMIKISPPTVKIKFEPNTSPLLGRDGKFVTAKLIQQRLELEKEQNIGLEITKGDGASYYVAGRGELHLSILIETMRREGYEFQIRKPEIVIQKIDGVDCEPLEELIVDTQEMYVGTITEALNQRNAELVNIENDNGQIRMTYKILTRNLFGLRNFLLTATKGNVVLNSFILDYVKVTKQPDLYRKGVLISSENGTSIGYALNTIQERGDLFIGSGVELYEGMIIGINKYEHDLDVNAIKGRQKSAVRMKHDEITQTALKAPIALTLEYALVFLNEDEILEVTPLNLRLRKQYLTKNERVWAKRDHLSNFAQKNLGK
jgi:GTP-binding protein